jgi:hypothetical protein
LISFNSGKLPNNALFVVGATGVGKSSLLRIFEKTAEAEKLLVLHFDVPDQIETTFRKLNDLILKFRVPEKKGFFSRKKSDEQVPKVTSIADVEVAVNNIISNVEERQLEKALLFTIDDCDIFFELQTPYILHGLIKLAEKVHKISLPVFIVLNLSNTRWEQIQNQYSHFPNMLIDRMEFSEAEILLRKVGNEIFQDADFRSEVVKLGDRSPFNVIFAIDVVEYFTKQIAEDLASLSSEEIENIKEKSIPFLRNIDYLGFISTIYELTDTEIRTMERLLEISSPVMDSDKLIQIGIPKDLLNPFLDCNLLRPMGSKRFVFNSFSFFERAGRKSEIDVLSQIGLVSDLISMDYKEGYKPAQTTITRLLQLSESVKGENNPDMKPLATKMEQLFKLAFNKKQYFAAFSFAQVTEKVFGACGDEEGRGIFLEESARKFVDAGKHHYAKDLFEKSINVFKHSEWKLKSSAREAANLYTELAKRAEKNDQMGLMRAYLWKAIILFEKAGEKERMKTYIDRAVGSYKTKDELPKKFFLELEAVGQKPNEKQVEV